MIVIPMAGLSKRFTEAGYIKPKFMLDLEGLTLFKHSVLSFKRYFENEKFLFITLDIKGYKDFIDKEVIDLGILDYEIVLLKDNTKGQADTVYQGLINCEIKTKDILIFNIDTFRPSFTMPKFDEKVDGFLEVFEGTGSNWSYIKTSSKDKFKVIETAEKRVISNHCCTGLYYFSDYRTFIEAFNYSNDNNIFVKGELYIAPLYNYLINNNYYISYSLIKREEVVFCGTPHEYTKLLEND